MNIQSPTNACRVFEHVASDRLAPSGLPSWRLVKQGKGSDVYSPESAESMLLSWKLPYLNVSVSRLPRWLLRMQGAGSTAR